MRTNPAMTALVKSLAQKHDLDLAQPGAELHLTHSDHEQTRLVVKRVGPNQVSVTRYTSTADIPDPETVFFTGGDYANEWPPIEFIRPLTGDDVMAAEVTSSGKAIVGFRAKAQADLARQVDDFAAALTAQNWLEKGQKLNTTP